jgi:nucleotide-binding universal stress UspA family protein
MRLKPCAIWRSELAASRTGIATKPVFPRFSSGPEPAQVTVGANVMEFKHILFPVDFSRRAHGAAAHIRGLVQRFRASLTLVHAAEEPWQWYGGVDAPVLPAIPWPEIEADAQSRLDAFAAAEFPGMSVGSVILRGDPATTVINYAGVHKVDMIALPTHGRGIFRAALLGSVTAKILHDSPCPVWTDAHCEKSPVHADRGWRSILCAIDTGPESNRLIHAAADLGKQCDAVVRLVHAVPGGEAGQERSFDMEFRRFLEDTARSTISDLQHTSGTSFEVCLGAGSPGQVVKAEAEYHDADLVIIGHGHLRALAGRLRTDTYGIIRSASCPVLSL